MSIDILMTATAVLVSIIIANAPFFIACWISSKFLAKNKSPSFTFETFVLIEYIKEIDGEFNKLPSIISKIDEICTSLFLFPIF